MADKKASAKSKVEAILFSVGHKISLEEIGKLSRSGKEEVLEAKGAASRIRAKAVQLDAFRRGRFMEICCKGSFNLCRQKNCYRNRADKKRHGNFGSHRIQVSGSSG